MAPGKQFDGLPRGGHSGMRIFFSAGEPSGDQHAARLTSALQKLNPEIRLEGFGGPAMQAAGCHLLFELTTMAVMGFLRVLPLLARFRRLVQLAEAHFDSSPPDAVVLVDFPGFNWWIAKAAKKRGIPVIYYLPPQLWAWAPWRLKKVRRWVDHVLCTLPFEYNWYRDRGIECSHVEHPFFDQAADYPIDEELVRTIRGTGAQPVVALLPGSRRHEIAANWEVQLQIASKISAEIPEVRWVVGSYREDQLNLCQEIQQRIHPELRLAYQLGKTPEVIAAADFCLLVSGSISLELLARQRPGIVLYRIGSISRFLSRFLMHCRFITLPNLIAERELMPEFISSGNPQSDITEIAEISLHWIRQPDVFAAHRREFRQLSATTAVPGASDNAARRICELLQGESAPNSPADRQDLFAA